MAGVITLWVFAGSSGDVEEMLLLTDIGSIGVQLLIYNASWEIFSLFWLIDSVFLEGCTKEKKKFLKVSSMTLAL